MSDGLAAFDDSGEAHPRATSEFFATAVVAVHLDKVRTLSQQWDNLIRTNVHNCPNGSIELKSSDSYNAWNMTRRNQLPKPGTILEHSTHSEIDATIKAVWQFLSSPTCSAIYLAATFNKEAYWSRFSKDEYQLWQTSQDGKAGALLKSKIEQDAFYFLVQRVQYLMEERSGHRVLIGDESIHSIFTNGDALYTNASRIVTTVAFGSSAHSPIIQIADWIGFAVVTWCRRLDYGHRALHALLPRFRGYPDHIVGRGILLNPDNYPFPDLP